MIWKAWQTLKNTSELQIFIRGQWNILGHNFNERRTGSRNIILLDLNSVKITIICIRPAEIMLKKNFRVESFGCFEISPTPLQESLFLRILQTKFLRVKESTGYLQMAI